MAVTYLGDGFSQVSTGAIKKESFMKQWIFPSYRYYMRGRDTLGAFVLWIADFPDTNGAQSTSPNKPFTNVAILEIRR